MIGASIGVTVGTTVGASIGGGSGGASPPAVTRDATSGRYVPASATEWTALLAGSGIANPTHLWLMQESADPFADTIGSAALARNTGSPSFAQTVSGWTRKALVLADGGNASFKAIGPAGGGSALVFAYVGFPATVGAVPRSVLTFGNTFGTQVAMNVASSGPMHVDIDDHGSSAVTGTHDMSSAVHPVLLQANKTGLVDFLLTDLETITHAMTAGNTVDDVFLVGGDDLISWFSGGASYLYIALWYGATAELSGTQLATLKSLLAG